MTNAIQIENAKTTFFSSKETYLGFRKAWALYAQERNTSRADILLFNLLRGKPSTHGFTPITNPIKLANGASPYGAHDDTLYWIRHCLRKEDVEKSFMALSGCITKEMLHSLLEYLR